MLYPYNTITPQTASNFYVATYNAARDLEGIIDFKATIKDLAGNVYENFTRLSITDGSFIEYDTQAPDASGIVIDLKRNMTRVYQIQIT